MFSASRLLSFATTLAPALALACAPPNPATPYPTAEPPEGTAEPGPSEPVDPLAIDFLDRRVDLEPFLRGFPYRNFMPALDHDRLYFMATGERYELRMAALPRAGAPVTSLDLATAEPVSPVDWSQRSLWSVHVQAQPDMLWLHADASNDEQMNLWRIDLAKPLAERTPEQITFADYVYAYGFSADDQHVAYLARSGQRAPYRTCLRVLETRDPSTDREVVCDSPELAFTWGTMQFSADASKVYFNAQLAGDRKRVQIVEVDLRAKLAKPKLITDPNQSRSFAGMLDGWVGEWLVYTADDQEFGDVHAWSSKTRKTRKLTSLTEELLGATLTDRGILLAHGTPAGSTLELIDRKTGKLLGSASAAGSTIAISDGHGDRAIWSQESPTQVFELSLAGFSTAADGSLDMQIERLVALAPELERSLVRCQAERVEIPTFDGRMLHAYLLTPREPLAGSAIAMIRSFYGGANEWTDYDQILCAAGITVVSPAVRGSSGFGKQFDALNDRDLGGSEIVDLFWVARWTEQRLGIGRERIGVYGRSHGGYATLRALTYPHDDRQFYRFGFGLAEAGFSDIAAFHSATNIPDWVVLEAGDPNVPADLAQLRDRSPLTHVDQLDVPVFLLHGANDWRVPVEGSRAFADQATKLGKSVTYLEVAGQGHRIEGDTRIVESWQARFDFIASVIAGPT